MLLIGWMLLISNVSTMFLEANMEAKKFPWGKTICMIRLASSCDVSEKCKNGGKGGIILGHRLCQ